MKIGRRIYDMHNIRSNLSEKERLPKQIRAKTLGVFWIDLHNAIRNGIYYPIIHGCNTHTYIQ